MCETNKVCKSLSFSFISVRVSDWLQNVLCGDPYDVKKKKEKKGLLDPSKKQINKERTDLPSLRKKQ